MLNGIQDNEMNSCPRNNPDCDGPHDDDYCCICGHFHSGDDHPISPCGDYRCCIN